jgi:hypothetical protein
MQSLIQMDIQAYTVEGIPNSSHTRSVGRGHVKMTWGREIPCSHATELVPGKLDFFIAKYSGHTNSTGSISDKE